MKITSLTHHLSPYLDPDFCLSTRIHPANQYFGDKEVWIKREDELSGSIIGSKYRKYASLLPFFRESHYTELWIVGSEQSNNVMGLLQMACEYNIPYRLLLWQTNNPVLKGNSLWTRMIADPERIDRVKQEEMPDYQTLIDQKQKEQPSLNPLIVPEGADTIASLPGLMTLAKDIANQEADKTFEHIFIDSGTGQTAIALVLGLSLLGKTNKTIHITLTAGDQATFTNKLSFYQEKLPIYFPIKNPERLSLPKLAFYRPETAPAFGAINKTCFKQIQQLAKEEGILTDPIYGIKHFYTCQSILKKNALSGQKLIIHNGGILGLSGFQEQLASLIP